MMTKDTRLWNCDLKYNWLTRLDVFLSTFAFSVTTLISIHFLTICWSCKSIIANMRLSFPSISVISCANASACNLSRSVLDLVAWSVTRAHSLSVSTCFASNSLWSCLLVAFRSAIWLVYVAFNLSRSLTFLVSLVFLSDASCRQLGVLLKVGEGVFPDAGLRGCVFLGVMVVKVAGFLAFFLWRRLFVFGGTTIFV